MDPRPKMVQFLKDNDMTHVDMAKLLDISSGLMRMVLEGEVTHPHIADKMGKAFGLTQLEVEELLPLCRREHGGSYDPDRYKSNYEDVRPASAHVDKPASLKYRTGRYQETSSMEVYK